VATDDHLRRIEDLCQAALDCDANERGAFLGRVCAGDEVLRREVESLLVHTDAAQRFLDVPPIEAFSHALASDAASLIGQHIAHYRIVEEIGAGGMGVVYRAEDTKLRRSVALKFLLPDLVSSDEAKRRFVFEAQAASALEHPNIGTIYEIGEAPEGRLFLAMAYYAGETLKAKIERGALPVQDALGYAAQIAAGLVAAHASGIVHRDIKPANIVVSGDGTAKIVDFGIAKLVGHPHATRTGATPGTLAYMAPEQRAGSSGDARSDVWSLGVVLHEMLVGRLPFVEEAHASGIGATDGPERLVVKRPVVPIALWHIVNRTLARDPNRRYQTAADLLTALRTADTEPAIWPGTSKSGVGTKVATVDGSSSVAALESRTTCSPSPTSSRRGIDGHTSVFDVQSSMHLRPKRRRRRSNAKHATMGMRSQFQTMCSMPTRDSTRTTSAS
jgi:serine/threonine-protein kinase